MYVDIINEQDNNLILKQKNTSIWGSINKTRKFFLCLSVLVFCARLVSVSIAICYVCVMHEQLYVILLCDVRHVVPCSRNETILRIIPN